MALLLSRSSNLRCQNKQSIKWILADLVKRNQNNKVYPKGWRVRKQRRLYRICFRTSDANKHYWNNQTEYLLGSGATLGVAEKQAYKIWTERIVTTDKPFTLQDLFDRYELQVIPNKAAATQKSNRQSFKRLRNVFDLKQPVIDFKTHQAYQYRDYVGSNLSAKRANLDVEVLSHLFTKAVEWGCNIQHPIKGIVGKISIPDRDRYVDDEELKAFLTVCNAMQKVYIPLKLATGKDKSMLLRIKLNDITSEGIKFPKRQKTAGKKGGKASIVLFEHQGESTGLKDIIYNIMYWRQRWCRVQSFYLFASSTGQPLITEDGITSNFDSQWQRTMKKALATTSLAERFTEHDLKAKTASDAENAEQASKLLQHHNTSTTQRIYRRKPEPVVPLIR